MCTFGYRHCFGIRAATNSFWYGLSTAIHVHPEVLANMCITCRRFYPLLHFPLTQILITQPVFEIDAAYSTDQVLIRSRSRRNCSYTVHIVMHNHADAIVFLVVPFHDVKFSFLCYPFFAMPSPSTFPCFIRHDPKTDVNCTALLRSSTNFYQVNREC